MRRYLLEHPVFYELLASTDVETFEVASDAFLTFRELLTRHESLTRDFLAAHGDQFFKVFNASLLMSTNYVTRRQSLKLLGELLLSSGHVDAMMRYVSEASYLKLIMTLLRDPSRSIQYEAFHLFKVMVANPNKPAGVVDILKSNGDRLTRFLSSFQSDRDENDADFATEKQTLIGMLNKL
jgi:calcium binding protein 39